MSDFCILLVILFTCILACLWKSQDDGNEQFQNGVTWRFGQKNKLANQKKQLTDQIGKLESAGFLVVKKEIERLQQSELYCIKTLQQKQKDNDEEANVDQEETEVEPIILPDKTAFNKIRALVRNKPKEQPEFVQIKEKIIEPVVKLESIIEQIPLGPVVIDVAKNTYTNNSRVSNLQAYIQENYDVYKPVGAGVYGFVLRSLDGQRAIKLLNTVADQNEFDMHQRVYNTWNRLKVTSFVVPKPFRYQKTVDIPLRAYRQGLWMQISVFYEMELLPPLVTIQIGNRQYDTLIQPDGANCRFNVADSVCVVSSGQEQGLDKAPPKGIFCSNIKELKSRTQIDLPDILGQIYQVHFLSQIMPYDTEFVITKKDGKAMAANIDFGLCSDISNLTKYKDNIGITRQIKFTELDRRQFIRFCSSFAYHSTIQYVAKSISSSRYIYLCDQTEKEKTMKAITTPLPNTTEYDKKYLEFIEKTVIQSARLQLGKYYQQGQLPTESTIRNGQAALQLNSIQFNTPQVDTVKLQIQNKST